ncbi:LysR substrate-binding domain-containing protein [Acuticoccus kandeliae]|uniref:LysR substrate-binding domain-containing protein n=1 Tax=Acuticoccus kandeliae TaxID=2073160 RepID=UPI00196B8681|nr:LysR substrate-binding domain-containing protein [Acuticoccus kandeliae]
MSNMRRRLPPLIALRAFEAFARTGVVRTAAEELAVSHTVVSRHIQNLEAALGAKLVKKSGRGLELTLQGVRYASHLTEAFNLIAEASDEVWRGPEEPIHVCCMAGLASRRLLGRLPKLEARLGGQEVILEPMTRRANFARGEAHAEITYLVHPECGPGLRMELLCRPRIVPIASPSFLAAHPSVKTVGDLLSLPLIHERSTREWQTWLAQLGETRTARLRGPRLWHGHMTMEAALIGQGVALVSELLAEDRVAAGDLVEVIPSAVYLGGYYFIAPARRWNDPPIASLFAWLAEDLANPSRRVGEGAVRPVSDVEA